MTEGQTREWTAEEFQKVAFDIFNTKRTHELELRVTAGAKIVGAFYEGDLNLFNLRNQADQALPRLAEELEKLEPEGHWSASWLNKSVRLYEQSLAFDGLKSWPHLTVSHFIAVQGLLPDNQRGLLDTAEAERWSVRRLAEAASLGREKRAASPKRDADAAIRLLRRMHLLLDEGEKITAGLREAGVPEQLIGDLNALLDGSHRQIEIVEQKLAEKQVQAD